MASELSDFATLQAAVLAGNRTGGPNVDAYQHDLEYFRCNITITEAANAAGDYYVLGNLKKDNLVVIPEFSGVRYPTGSTGTMTDVVLTLAKLAEDGTTITDLTGPLTASGAIGEKFTDFAAATTLPTVSATDTLILRVTSITTLTAGRTLTVEAGFVRQN